MLLVLCSCPPEVADKIAKILVDKSLASCINSVPKVQKTYQLSDKLCVQEQTLLFIQTTEHLFKELTETIIAIHPSSVPEIVSLQLLGGNRQYMEWAESILPKGIDVEDADDFESSDISSVF